MHQELELGGSVHTVAKQTTTKKKNSQWSGYMNRHPITAQDSGFREAAPA